MSKQSELLSQALALLEKQQAELDEARQTAYFGWVVATGYPIAEWVYEYHPWLRTYKPPTKEKP